MPSNKPQTHDGRLSIKARAAALVKALPEALRSRPPAQQDAAASIDSATERRAVLQGVGAVLTGSIVGVPVYRTGRDLSAVAQAWIEDARDLGMVVIQGPDGNLWRAMPYGDSEERQAARERHWIKLNNRPPLLRAVYAAVEDRSAARG